jgi:6-phosphogluconolactonase
VTLEIQQFADANKVSDAVADAFIERLLEVLVEKSIVHVAITGGTVGILSLAKIGNHAKLAQVDFNRIHIWWGDERFVTADSSDRNAIQAYEPFLGKISIPADNVHLFPASDEGLNLEQAASDFAAQVLLCADETELIPFDVMLMGMGPDGHIASLFPGHNAPAASKAVVFESNSPKPPSERLSFSYQAINYASEIWFTVAGADKAAAVADSLISQTRLLPAGKVAGTKKTRWFLDEAAYQE